MFGSCPSKLDREMLPLRMGVGQSSNMFYGISMYFLNIIFASPLKFLNLLLIPVQNWMATGHLDRMFCNSWNEKTVWLTKWSQRGIYSSSRSQMLFGVGILKNFANFTGKHLCWSPFLIKLQAWNFIKKRLQHRCFPAKFAKFLRTAFFKENLRWLFQYLVRHRQHLKRLETVGLFST